MTIGHDQTLRNRMRERAKLAVRGGLQRLDLDLSKGSYSGQVVRTIEARGITDVFDIGANVGQFAVGLRSAGFRGRIISCEPLSGAFAQLQGRAAHDAAWEVVNAAVGAAAGEVDINVSANSYSSSILGMTQTHLDGAPDSGYVAVEHIGVTTVEELTERFNVDPTKALLKIDTQGYEPEVLAGAGELLGSFDAVQLEISFVELYEDQVLADAMLATLREQGYRLQTLTPGFADPDGRLLQCDVLMVRAD